MTVRPAFPPELRLAYPDDLPVSDRRDDILAALAEHQVLVLSGETGSGKTTQIPKMCLEAGTRDGSGRMPRIAHTQPRRIAARAVAERLAEEMAVPVGGFVGYRVRFTDETAEDTAVTVMTDGLLLASIRQDKLLRQFDTIIVDEAHERSLNIDFLLGYLAWLLPQRPDLTVVITSATLDTERFATHFGGAPVIEVTGRSFPVEVRYRPLSDDEDEVQGVTRAVGELLEEGPGDILVFLSGEREIRDAADAVSGAFRHVEVVPLFGRLSAAEQHRVFAAHEGRRVVLSTNVAETSLTVPGIHYVVDTGTARISRYSTRLKIQRLPIEPISQASAQQRAGRCGRVAAGVCIRLYADGDFAARPAFTDPEILRTNLASVLLQMATLGLGDIASFPFIDAPDRRSIAAGLDLLEEIGALRPGHEDVAKRVTSLGRRIARLPLDPRLARMVIAAQEAGVADDVIVIAAGLTVRDPRERPEDKAATADASHARFQDPTSDLLGLLRLWDYVDQAQGTLSSSKFRALCRQEYLHYLRIREWQDLVAQVSGAAREGGRRGRTPRSVGGRDRTSAQHRRASGRDSDAIHRAVLSGLLSHIGMLAPEPARSTPGRRPAPLYRGARGTSFSLWPGSALARPVRKADTSETARAARRGPAWVMAAELVETTRLWGRMVAAIQPEWIEAAAPHLLRRTYGDPVWSRRRAMATCREQATVYGLPVVSGRTVSYDRIDADVSREMFIRHALVQGEWQHRHHVLDDNQQLLAEARELEERGRQRGAVMDDDALYAFYDRRLPASIVSGRHFDAWWRRARETEPDLLRLTREEVVDEQRMPVEEEFPSIWRLRSPVRAELTVAYRFSPGDPRDGATVFVPVDVLPALPDSAFDWQVPGLRGELITGLLRALPKDLRRAIGPAPNATEAILRRLVSDESREAPLPQVLSEVCRREFDVQVPPSDWRLDDVPSHARMTIVVVADNGQEMAEGKDLGDLRARLGAQAAAAVAQSQPGLHHQPLSDWPSDVEWTVTTHRDFHTVTAYPTIVPQPDGGAALEVLASEADQRRLMPLGTARLLCLRYPLKVSALRLSTSDKLVLARNPQGSVHALLAECCEAVAQDLLREGPVPLDETSFRATGERFREVQHDRVHDMLEQLVPVLQSWWSVMSLLDERQEQALRAAVEDMRKQMGFLLRPGFLLDGGHTRLPDLGRYLRAAERRAQSLPVDAVRDLQRREQLDPVLAAFDALPESARESVEGHRIRMLIEEFRVSLWAQDLRTREPVSSKRILSAIESLARAGG